MPLSSNTSSPSRCSSKASAYWKPEPDEGGAAHERESEEAKLDRLDALLDETVRDRLVADVPVGVFLSGGIDSSLVAALVGKHAPGLTAFTIRMPEASYDETPAARALARSLRPFEMPKLAVANLSGFLAVRETMPNPELQALADACLFHELGMEYRPVAGR